MKLTKSFFLFLTTVLLICSLGNAQETVAHPKSEFRAVWIATVVNIDWPKNGIDSIEKQKADYLEILDTYKKLNYNAVIVQIRSVGDAFYPSQLAPWSKYLTGKEGKAPANNFDPLAWMIDEAHNRGFEFHAWLNPYRATMDLNTAVLSPTHDFFKHPEWMIKYGGKYYYNPALPEVQTHLVKVVDEVVTNYDIDAIHFDDYFYPYKIPGEQFNDSLSYKKYNNGLALDDWRRDNVNAFVKSCAIAIKSRKPWVQFGISPFGVWRNKSVDPKGSDTQSGQTNYDDLFADVMTWMEYSWVDYVLPQLYWSMDHRTASYSKLLKWWSENSKNTAIYIGNSSYKINSDSDKRWNNPYEIPNQIDITRSYKNVNGNAYFSAKSFVNKNKAVTDILMQNQYKYPALPYVVPNSRKAVTDIPTIFKTTTTNDNSTVTLHYPVVSKVRYVVVYEAKNGANLNLNDASQIIDKIAIKETKDTINIVIKKNTEDKKNRYALTYIDYYGNESMATPVTIKPEKKPTQTEIKNESKQ
ncbi:glycoside hydrolase family 10 protein [Flavobacterium muglaense]|uniref:Family 10 glycosylhydrolase n=1 Tax=Flavobacterium muglaense TaxID=2764716 RepID=A0A923MZD9_9FLAO|nr:family 10 glycosylhydrolase [Flavobacterium muglaense]MBC5836745.1 family 10 glycosylhydrolase [Flavobacterium muglaense]MBC5843305.1 family 10 glycosylhydrolase [Flavobacterium muglaense]